MNNQIRSSNVFIAPGNRSPVRYSGNLEAAEGSQERKRQFASLAHELRNPLSTINLSVEMLKTSLADDNQKSLLDMIIRASTKINYILSDIHSSCRTNKITAERYSIHQLLDEVLTMAGDKIMLKHISLLKEYAANDSKISLNRPQLKIALTNIIINAIDAMTSGEGNLKMVTKSTDQVCVVTIEDNGCGISRQNLKKIFKPYFTKKPGGLGIGLATTREILRSNHVRVYVRSAVGKGTSFILAFDKKL